MSTSQALPQAAGRLTIKVRGVVQGVGFRPFVYRTARELGLAGWVRNQADLVQIEVQGPEPALAALVEALRTAAPPQVRIERLEVTRPACAGDLPQPFQIAASSGAPGTMRSMVARPTIPADLATCAECRAEIRAPDQRRYGYPFTNCTNCGPRWSIIRALPYDRPRTSMAGFSMCPACEAEYADPADRRFHAQPIACPACGPQLATARSRRPGNGIGRGGPGRRRRGPGVRPDRGPPGAGRLSTPGRRHLRRGSRAACAIARAGPTSRWPLCSARWTKCAATAGCRTRRPASSCRPPRRSFCSAARKKKRCQEPFLGARGGPFGKKVPDTFFSDCRSGCPGQSVPGRDAPLYAAAPLAHGCPVAAGGLHQRQSVRGADGHHATARPGATRPDRRRAAGARSADRPARGRLGGPGRARRLPGPPPRARLCPAADHAGRGNADGAGRGGAPEEPWWG